MQIRIQRYTTVRVFPADRFYTRILEPNEIVNRYSVAKLSMPYGLWPKHDTAAFAKIDG